MTEIPSQPIPISAHSSGTLLVGSILKDPEFQGSAVVSATVPILAVYKQSASGSEPYSPVLYNSFAMTESGQYAYLPSVQLNTAYNTQVGIQNLLGSVVTLDLELIDSEDPGVTYSPGSVVTIQPQSSYIFNVSDLVGGGNFTGSMVASAEVLGQPGTPGKIVAVAKDVQGGGRRAYAYEGVAGGSTDVYLPTAMCQYAILPSPPSLMSRMSAVTAPRSGWIIKTQKAIRSPPLIPPLPPFKLGPWGPLIPVMRAF